MARGKWGVAGVPFTSADQSAADAAVTDAPVSGKKLVIEEVLISVGATAQSVTLKEETSGTVIAGPFHMAAMSTVQLWHDSVAGKPWRLPVADKKLMVRVLAAGNIMVHVRYRSE